MKRRIALATALAVPLLGLTVGFGTPVQAAQSVQSVQTAPCISSPGPAETAPDAGTDSSAETTPGPDTSSDLSFETDQSPDTTTDSSPETDQSPDTTTDSVQAAGCTSADGASATSAAATPRRSDGYKTLILLHGFTVSGSVDCSKYWGGGKVEKYLNNKRGWAGKVKKLTFYSSGGKNCTRIPGSGGTGHAIEDLGSSFAWYIYNTYSRYGVPVDVIAHSMGGLVTRTALTGTQKHWTTASGRNFPPYLYIEDVATLSSPHEGARASVWGGCSTSRFQVCEMVPGSSFLRNWIAPYGNPQSKMGTDWSFIGSGADWVVNTGSALNTKASRHPGHKYLFLSGSGLDHGQMANITEDGRGFNYPIKYCHYNASCNMTNWDHWPQIAKGAGPLWVAANAVFYASW